MNWESNWGDDGNRDVGESVVTHSRVPHEVVVSDHVYEALSHRYSRHVCNALCEHREWSLTDLVEEITVWEADVPAHEISETERETIRISLYHSHLPRLAELGVIEFDRHDDSIVSGATAEEVLLALHGIDAALRSV